MLEELADCGVGGIILLQELNRGLGTCPSKLTKVGDICGAWLRHRRSSCCPGTAQELLHFASMPHLLLLQDPSRYVD